MTKIRDILLYVMAIGSFSVLSCCKSDDPVPPGPPTPPGPDPDPPVAAVPIRLHTQLMSRSIIESFDSTALYIAKGNSPAQYDEIWEAVATEHEIRFVPERYYPADSSALHLTGYYPQAPATDGFVDFYLDGQTDVITAKVQSGSLVEPFEEQAEPFLFRHQLALLKIKVYLSEDRPETYYLKSLGLNGSSEAARLDLASGELLFGADAPKLVLYEAGAEGSMEISASSAFNGNLLVQPRTELTVDLILSKDGNPEHDLVYTGLAVHFSGDGSEGNVAYNIDIIVGSPDLPINPDNPDDPDPPVPDDPDDPDDPDYPDIPVPPVKPPVVPDDPVDPDDPSGEKPSITITATVTGWTDVPGGDLDFIPSNK